MAIDQGLAAGANLAGSDWVYRRQAPFNVTRLAGLVTTIIGQVGREPTLKDGRPTDSDLVGINRGDSETWRSMPDARVAQTYAGDNRLRLLVSGNRIVGALVAGDQDLSRPLQNLIRAGTDIGPLRARLLEPDAPLAELIHAYWKEHEREIRAEVGRKA